MKSSENNKKLTAKEVRKQLVEIILLFHKDKDSKEDKKPSSLQEIIDYLRVSVKYLLLDIEASRREAKEAKGKK